MPLTSDLEECCVHLESNRITDRKKFCNKLSTLLDNVDVINILNEGKSISWRRIISSLQECLRKDADKKIEDAKKKNCDTAISTASELFMQTIEIATSQSDNDVDISELSGYIIGCMRDNKMKKCYFFILMNILNKCILEKSKSRDKLDGNDWEGLYEFLKYLSSERSRDMLTYKCLNLLIKWGPSSGLQASVLREGFSFLTKFCQLISQHSPKPLQEDTLEIAIDFCRHTAKDNRVSCCKFGEDVLPSFIHLYELNGKEARIKELLVQFFLLQVIIHQPNGVKEGHPLAYAFSWQTWNKCSKMIYVLLSKETQFYFQNRQKNTSFFKSQGDSMTLSEDFTILFVEISRQLFFCTDMDCTMSLDCTVSSQIPQKRQKIEVVLRSYVISIQESKSWLWIHIVNSMIKKYPDIIGDEDYLLLLQILSTIQIESNDHNVVQNIYYCLSTMLSIHCGKLSNGDNSVETEKLWKTVGESTTRAFALNQHKAVTEVLLEKLLKNSIIDIDSIFQIYTSGILTITSQSIMTLQSALDLSNIDHNEHCKKEKLMRCILNPQNVKEYKYLLESVTAEFLVKLTLNEWPKNTESDYEERIEKYDDYRELTEIYLKTTLDDDAVVIKNKKYCTKEKLERNYSMDLESATLMTDILKNFVQNSSDTEEVLLSILTFIVNIASYAIEYNILSETQINDSVFIDMIRGIFEHEKIKKFDLYKSKNEREAKRLIECVDILDKLFSSQINKWMMKKLKSLVPLEFLRSLNIIFNELQDENKKKCNFLFDLKKGILKALSSFSCVYEDCLNENQANILEVLSAPSYYFDLDDDCTLFLTFLRCLKSAKPGVLPDSVLDNVLKSIQELCAARYQYSTDAVEILEVLLDLFPHFAASNDEDNKNTSVALLKPFYDNYTNYGPAVTLKLLDCIKKLCQIDSQCKFSLWYDIEVVRYVPEFLSSDFQEVRFKAIDTLVEFFSANSHIMHLRDFHRQEEIFAKINEMSKKVFEVGTMSTNERRIDEVICRTASVLHTFTGIILNNNSWIEECLFALMKLSFEKEISYIDRILKVISKHLLGEDHSNIMEKYIERLIERWLREGYQFDNFQFKLFNCDTKAEFYLKYFEKCVPYVIMRDNKDLLLTAKQLNLTEVDVVKKTSAKIFSRVICDDIENMGEHLIERNKILAYYTAIVGIGNLKEILTNSLEKIILGVLEFLADEIYTKDTFGENIIYPSKHLNVAQLKTCLAFIESYLCNGQSLIAFLSPNLGRIENILLALKLDLYDAISIEEKFKALHRYTFFVTMVSDIMKKDSHWQYYFLRDTIYTLINILDAHIDFPSVMRAACKFLNIFIRKLLPSFPETVGQFLTSLVNSLKVFAVSQSVISVDCMNILDYLIVENNSKLMNQIEKLDNFPNHECFQKIRIVHSKIRYDNKKISLEDEITLFLKHTDISTQQDSLIHLRKILSERKNDLKELYDKLQDIRGFSEDCEMSSLHRLICTLSKLSCSTNENVSLEAIRCLGELGPANLQTLVLQPEKTISDTKCHPFEHLSGHVISLLSEYLIDKNIDLIKTASETFYDVMDCKESRRIAESDKDFGNGPINKKYILPFFPPTKASPSSKTTVDQYKFCSRISEIELWCPEEKKSHEDWIISLVSELLNTFTDQSYLQKLIPVCRVKPEFAEQLLPLLVNLLLAMNNSKINDILLKKIDYFFAQHWQYTVPKCVESNSITLNKKSVKCMLDVVVFIRLQRSFNSSKSQPGGELNINYLKVAKAAEFCAAHFSALLYSELWCQSKIEDIQNQNVLYCEKRSTMLDFIYEDQGSEMGEALQNILRNAYKSIGDLDALPGCGISFLLQPQSRVEHYKELGKWDQVTQFYAMQLFHSKNLSTDDLMESFKKNSLYQIPLLCSNNLDNPQYECMWRLGQWTNGEKRKSSTKTVLSQEDFEKYRYFSLKALHDNNFCTFDETKKKQSLCIIDHLKHTSLESSQSIYPVLTRLQSLVEMEDLAKSSTIDGLNGILSKWKLQDNIIQKSDFQYVEPIITQRLVMLSEYMKKNHNDDLKEYVCDLSLDFANLAKDEGLFKEGLTILENLKCMSDISENVKTKIQLLDAQLSWLVNNKLVARHILNRLCKNEQICPKLRSSALKLSGQYMSETHSENRTTIISDYFLSSVKLMSRVNRNEKDVEDIMDTYDKLALFADKEYQMIMMYTKSESFQRKIVNMEKAKKEASNIQKQRKRTHDELKAAAIHDKQSNIDKIEINNTRVEGNQFLKLAFKYYLLTLVHSEDRNIRIFRTMSLFLENRNNDQIADTVEEHLPKLPTHKYITMLPQLIPHITETNTDLFSRKVNEIVEKCAIDHPHHTLPLLLSLVNANMDKNYCNVKGSVSNTSKNDNRVSTAKNLLTKLKKRGSLSVLIDRLQQVSLALIDLAYYSDKNSDNDRVTQFNIPRSQKIMSIQNFDDVLLPTYTLNVEPSTNYSRIVGISSFGSVYHPVGGINKPKRITCRGTDGQVHSQLVKGQDDIRQDAVMQQVFNIMNNLLSINKQTKKLLIRTYKVVPLSMRSGILKWVDDSMPIGEYLVGEKNKIGAHQMFRPNDKTPTSCRNTFKNCAGQSAEAKLDTYREICKNFKPVFHKFFQSFFPQPTIWYERRRAYIHSVATTSMCGYVLGIGDRHVSNILIDKSTAEVIHIDFGIAFEQGRVLPTPETVPFRLTRDVVDGMGVSGVEGIFRRSCEKTMEVLRQNSQTIITILEVLLYDPLYAWTVTSAEANKRQTDDDIDLRNMSNQSSDEENITVNVTAERALLRLREKLQGTELGHPTSIEHQVGTLIQQAIDPANLCKLFVGWQPYL